MTGVEEREIVDEPPPILGRWRRVYALIITYLFVLIGALYATTKLLSY